MPLFSVKYAVHKIYETSVEAEDAKEAEQKVNNGECGTQEDQEIESEFCGTVGEVEELV